MRKVLLDELAELQQKLKELENSNEIYTVRSKDTHLSLPCFIASFDEYKVEYDEGDIYPYRLAATYNGATFMALASKQEAKQYGIQIQK